VKGRSEPREARLYSRAEGDVVVCGVCNNACRILPGSRGVCGNYANRGGKLYHVGYGKVSAAESRPIELKPLYHYWPGSTSLTFSGWGCNFYCPWCQNYHLSFRKPQEDDPYVDPEALVKAALENGDEGVCASFNEPATLFDYVCDVFELATSKGLYASIVTNGYFTLKAAEELVSLGCDGWSIDIKGCPKAKRALAAVDHEHVIKVAKRVLDAGGHVEMVFLVVTGYNDFEECFEWVSERVADALGPDVPLHVNRYFPHHLWNEPPTSLEKLLKASSIAKSAGLKYVYVGNVWDPELQSTKCPKCSKMLIYRSGYSVLSYNLTSDGKCPRCGERVPIRGRPVLKSPRFLAVL